MPDNTLRIVFEDSGGPSQAASQPSQAPSDSGRPVRGIPPSHAAQHASYSPIGQARQKMERQKKETEEWRNILKYGSPKGPEPSRIGQKFAGVAGAAGRIGSMLPGGLGSVASAGSSAVASSAMAASAGGGPVTIALASVAASAVAAGVALKVLDGQVMSVAESFREFSPAVQIADAQNEIRRTFGDIRRANEAGSQMAQMVAAQGQLDESVKDLFNSPGWLEFRTGAIKLLTLIAQGLNKTGDGVDFLGHTFGGIGYRLIKEAAQIELNTRPGEEQEFLDPHLGGAMELTPTAIIKHDERVMAKHKQLEDF